MLGTMDDAEKTKFSTYWANRGANTMEAILAKNKRKFAFGDKITAADVFFYPQIIASIRRGVDITAYPFCHSLYDMLSQVQEFANAESAKQPDFKP